MEDNTLLLWVSMGSAMGLASHYLLGWPVWLAWLTGILGPIVLGYLLLIGFFIAWGIIGD